MSHEEEDRKFVRSEEETSPANTQSLSDSDLSPDQELTSALWHWSAPGIPANLDNRVMASYRQLVNSRSGWRSPLAFWPTSLLVRFAAVASLCLLAFVLFEWGNSHGRPVTAAPLASSVIEGTDVEISGNEMRYVTYVHGSGFQPVRSVRMRINRGSDQDEN